MNQPQWMESRRKIDHALARVRSELRRYVTLRGLCHLLTWLMVTFWLAVAIDFFPVRWGMSELPVAVRATILVMMVAGAAWILWREPFQLLRRPVQLTSLALIVERRFPQFCDRLLTVVSSPAGELTENQRFLLATSGDAAADQLQAVRIRDLFNYSPLIKAAALFVALAVLSGLLVWQFPNAVAVGGERILGLSTTPWPRRHQLELVGIRVMHDQPPLGVTEVGQTRQFDRGEICVGRGSSATLLVRASPSVPAVDSAVPEYCWLRYRQGSRRGRVKMNRVGAIRDGQQLYSLDTSPLATIQDDIEFEIQGSDARLGPFSIRVVDPPTVVAASVNCRPPDYLTGQNLNLPTSFPNWSNGMQLPRGSAVQIQLTANKPLRRVYLRDLNAGEWTEVQPMELKHTAAIELQIPVLNQNWSHECVLIDGDGVMSENPFRVDVIVANDTPPHVEVKLVGIGSAVTPHARIPLSGSVVDDYGIAEIWIDVVSGQLRLREPVATTAGEFQTELDLLAKQRSGDNEWEFTPGSDDILQLSLVARDHCDLTNENVGRSSTFQLDILTPDQMLQLLEDNEVGLRRKLEGIYAELGTARDYFVRLQGATDAAEPIAAPATPAEEPAAATKDSLRLMFAQRAAAQIQKSTQEIDGLATQFDDLRLQLINNRIDSEDRKQRLSQLIVAPLQRMVTESQGEFPSLLDLQQACSELVVALKQTVEAQTSGVEPPIAASDIESLRLQSLHAANSLLSEIERILAALVKYESQSELLDAVRQLLEMQQALHEKTKQEQKRRVFEGLID